MRRAPLRSKTGTGTRILSVYVCLDMYLVARWDTLSRGGGVEGGVEGGVVFLVWMTIYSSCSSILTVNISFSFFFRGLGFVDWYSRRDVSVFVVCSSCN